MVPDRLPEAHRICKLAAVKPTARVNGRPVLVRPIGASAIEVLEAQADRIHPPMTAGAHRVVTMRGQPIPNSSPRRVFYQAEVHVRRRIGNGLTEDQFPERLASQRRRAAPRVRERRGEAQMRQNAGARAVFGKLVRHPAVLLLHRHSVDSAERAGQEGASGREQIAIVAVPKADFMRS